MKRLLALLLGCTLATGLFAAEDEIDTLRATLAKRLPDVTPDSIAPSPIPGLYELVIGTQVVYITGDGRMALQGRLLDLEQGTDLTEPVISEARLKLVASMPEEKMVIFEPEGEVKHTLTTFTDIDCPYCRKMHSEMALLNRMGIRVRYMLFPRTGVASPSYEKAVSVWCADDQQAEMTKAKSGATPEIRVCENPVREHMALAQRMGLRGTPFTITDTGRAVSGYVPAPQLLESLEADKRKASR